MLWEGLKSFVKSFNFDQMSMIVEFDALEIINVINDRTKELLEVKNITKVINKMFV